MGKGGAGKGGASKQGGRQPVSGPRQIGTIIEWKGAYGFIKPTKPISHPQFRGKVYLAAEDVAEELDGVGAKVSFTLYQERAKGLGAGDCRMAKAGQIAAAKNSGAQSAGKVPPTFSSKLNQGNKGAGRTKGSASTFTPKTQVMQSKFSKGAGRVQGKVAATGSSQATSNGSKFGKNLKDKVPQTAGAKALGAKTLGARTVVPPTWSKSPVKQTGQKQGLVKQTTFQKPRHGFQKGSFAKGVANHNAKGAGKGSGKTNSHINDKQKRQIIYDKPLFGTVTQWRGKFGWIKPKDTIDHPLASKHKGDLFLSQEDVEKEISGVGASVRFMLYEDPRGLGAAHVNPARY